MDALGHVNNAVYFRYFECARVEFLRRLGWSDRTTNASGPGFILHSVSARFRRPVRYPDTLTVRAFVTEVGTDRLTIGHTIHSAAQGGALVAEGSGVVVCYDYAAGCKVGLPGGFVAALGR
jgi:acyl-CoA thioester hydrolase